MGWFGESKEERRKRIDSEVLEHAQHLSKGLTELQQYALKPNSPDLLVPQAGLIFRLQQDIYKVFGINIARPESYVKSREGLAVYSQAFEAIEKLYPRSLNLKIEKQKKQDADGFFVGAMMAYACLFWMTSLFARSGSAELKLCVVKNHLVVASLPKEKVIGAAQGYVDLFFPTGDFQLESSHWPYVDMDRILEEYEETTRHDGSLANLYLRTLREQSDDDQ